MTISVTPSEQAFGAQITGVDLTQSLESAVVAEIRAAWLKYHVVSFPDQQMSDDDLERFQRVDIDEAVEMSREVHEHIVV